ncbi:MAG TPA: hypothetical protein DCL54_00095 [Alphaproteobacteria bacterium]|nr:hypothetical protein [Alphaproteobacteria bacterium]
MLISNLDFQSEGGPACMLVENARLQLNNVRINAPRSAAGIKGYDARVGAAGLWVFAGGPAVAASRTAVVLNNASIGTNGDVTFAPDAYGTEPSFRDAPIRYLAEDPDAPYMGGGNPGGYYPPASGYPVPGYPAPGYPPNGYAQPGYPGTPGPHDVPPPNGYPELPPPGAQIYPPDRAVPSVRPSFSGTPALFLDDSRADLTSVYVRGGSHGIAGFLSGAYPDRGITLRGVTITAASGSHGILAIQTGGFGQASGVVTAGGVYIQGFKTGIELQGTNSRISGVVMRDVRKGLVTDAHTTGEASTNQIAYGDECRCIAGDCGRGDVTTARFRFRGNVCND